MNFVFDVLLKLKNGANVYLDVVKFEHSEFFYIFHCPEPDGSIYVWKEFRDDVDYYVVRLLPKTYQEFECIKYIYCSEHNSLCCDCCDYFGNCNYCNYISECEYVSEKKHCFYD